MKKVMKIFAVLTLLILTCVFTVSAAEDSRYEYHDSSWYFSEEEAKAFIGFIYDLSPEDLAENTDIEHAVNLLTGKYADDPKTEKLHKIAFYEVAVTHMNSRVDKYNHASVITSNNLIEWLKSEANVDESGYEATEIISDFFDGLSTSIKKAIQTYGLTDVAEKFYKELSDVVGGIAAITDIKGKAEGYARAAKAGVETAIYTGASSRRAMYQYFLAYTKMRNLANSTVDGFELAMNYNVMALVNQGLYDPFLDWADEDNQKTLNRWAEFFYWLGEDVGEVEFTNDYTSGTITSTLEPVEFVPGTGTYEGSCGGKVKWHLDASTGVLNIYGEGSMTNYTSASKTPWYDYRQYINYVRVTDGVISIGNYAFAECTVLDKVYLSADVYNIGNRSFYNCVAMRLFVVDGIVNNIGPYAFANCKNLVYFDFPDRVTDISEGLFNGCTSLAYVEFPSDVVSIGSYAFNKCSALTGSIVIPDGVTSISKYAFNDCSSLTSILIPDGVTSIGDYAFNGCSGITVLTMPISAKIYEFTFNKCTNIEKVTLSKGTGIMPDYTSSGARRPWYISSCSTVIIESGVTNIGNYAFYGCSNLTSITIPYSVASIGNYAFCGCSGLTGITIPYSVKSIATYAFAGCSNLTSIKIPYSVTSIGERAFNSCSGITRILIPDSVTSIGNYAFNSCSGITELTMPISAKFYEYTFNDCTNIEKIILSKGTGIMPDYTSSVAGKPWYISGCSTVIIEDGVTNIGSYAFYGCSDLTSITIPDSVTSIGDYAFRGCSGLTGITIPGSVTSIGSYAFYKCTGFTGITIPDSVTSIGELAFYGCSDIRGSLVIPAGVTSIEYGAFKECISIDNITISNGVTSIGDSMFSGCKGLTKVTIPDSVTSIGSYAFVNCSGITSITIPDGVTSISNDTFSGCSGITSITIPDSVTSIGNFAFSGCSGITSITIPDGVTSIGNYAFDNCYRITELTMPVSAKFYNYTFDECTSIEKIVLTKGTGIMPDYYGGETFYNRTPWYISGCSTVIIEDGVTNIGSYAFSGCSDLTDITTPDSVTSIGNSAFSGCTGIKLSFIIPDGVTSIGNSAFAGCTGLTYITIPDGVTSIGDRAFKECSYLVEVVIPSSVTDMGQEVFVGCRDIGVLTVPIDYLYVETYKKNGEYYLEKNTIFDSLHYVYNLTLLPEASDVERGENTVHLFFGSELTKLTIEDGVKNIGNNLFGGCDKLKSITIPDSVKSIEASAFGGCDYLETVIIGNGGTSIGNYAFNGCYRLENLTIGEGASIGEGAFASCKALENVVIPDSVTDMAGKAFYGCLNLKNIIIGNNVTSIGEATFKGCTGLESIIIPDNVTSIGAGAFEGCTGLESITIGNSVTSIGGATFKGCTGLESIIIPDNVTSIGVGAFEECTGLESITIGNGVKSVGENAFKNCKNLKRVYIDDIENWCDIEFVDQYSQPMEYFQYANPLYYADELYLDGELVTEIVITSEITDADILRDYQNLRKIVFDESVTKINDEMFYNFSQIKNVIISGSVTSIGDSAFESCDSLESITISDGITSIGNAAFAGCVSLTNITIPSSVTSIGINAFYSGRTIDIYIDDIKAWFNIDFGENAYNHNIWLNGELLTDLVVPEGIKEINPNIMLGLGLKSLVIPEGVTSIAERAFFHCTALYCLSLPSTLKYIGYGAFGLDTMVNRIDKVYYAGTEEQFNKIEGDKETGWIGELHYNYSADKQHYFGNVIQEPTYYEGGIIEYSCSCGYSYEEYMPKNTLLTDKNTGASVGFNNYWYDNAPEFSMNIVNDNSAFNIIGNHIKVSRGIVYDIKMLSGGSYVQPVGKVTVKLPVPAEYNPERTYVYYVNTATNQAEKMNAVYENGYMVFETDHFSYYVVVEEEEIQQQEQQKPQDSCSCKCHKSGFSGFIWKILRFFYKLFKTNAVCACGIAHY